MKKLILAVAAAAALVISSSAQSDAAMRKKVFEKIWGTVNDKFYDPNFNGVDWKAVHDKYLPIVSAAKGDDDFYDTMREMLALLKVSHLTAGSSAQVERQFKSPPGVTGLGLREVEGRLTVHRILPDFPAAKAGIRPGFVIVNIDGKTPANETDAGEILKGAPGTSVKVTYLDDKDLSHEATLERQTLTDKGKIEGLDIYALFNSKRLDGGLGYISFSSFVPYLNDRIAAAFDEFKDAPGIIIDLRGNAGGDDSVALKIDDRLFEKETQLMLVKTRKGINRDIKAHGNGHPYTGKIVILGDAFSASASEDLTAGLQETGRAYVIGKKTAAQDLDADIQMLPDGGMLLYPFGWPTTPKGVPVEGRGVIPDKIVELKRADLLAGRDTQLDAAVQYLLAK